MGRVGEIRRIGREWEGILRKKTTTRRKILTLERFLTIISTGTVAFSETVSRRYSRFNRFIASRVRFDGDAPDKRSRALADEPIFSR